MKKKKRKPLPQQVVRGKPPTNLPLIGLSALLIARPLVPEDPGGQAGYGVAFIMLWLLLAMGWLAQQWRAKNPMAPFDLVDWLVIALIGWHSLAALVAGTQASPRPAVNMLWEWVGIGLAFLLARRIIQPGENARAVIATLLGLAVGLSLVAIEQRFISVPQDIRAFESARDDPARLFEFTGQWLPPGSSELTQFENRIKSQQPTASFALTNSLAGFLVPWSLMLTALLFGSSCRRNPSRWRFVAAGALWLAMFAAIYFTGSRTAILAVACGLAALAFFKLSRPRVQLTAIATTITILVVAALVWQSGYGREAFRGAGRSLAFRADYWRATLAMIADRPLLGWGPGQFQDSYTKYKLPTAPEEIQDPHNWLLEVTATAGIPAGILLVMFLCVVGWRIARSRSADSSDSTEGKTFEPWIGAACGLILGSVLAFTNGFSPPLEQIAIVAMGMVASWWALRPWVHIGMLDARTILIAAGALLLNLTAAGGIGYPSVADSLWLLAAVGLIASGVRKSDDAEPSSSNRWQIALFATCAAMFVLAYLTAYRPVTNSRAASARADAAILRGQSAEHNAAVLAAVEADPWSSRAALQLATLRLAEYTNRPNAERAKAVTDGIQELLRLAPHKSGAHVRASESVQAIYEISSDPEDLQSAIEHQRQAIALYPTSAEAYARLAKLLLIAKTTDSAARAAREALRLDDLMRRGGHADRQLAESLRLELRQIASGEATFDAEKQPAVE